MSDAAIDFKTSLERRTSVRKALAKRRQQLRELGICQDCGREPAAPNRTLGRLCLTDRRSRHAKADPLAQHPQRLSFTIPLTPPSVNHYVEHIQVRARGGHMKTLHIKTREAQAWERDFAIFARDMYIVSQSGRFAVTVDIFFAPHETGDVDNFPKCVLDCVAHRHMLRDADLKPCTDAWIKELRVRIFDTKADREKGPLTRITLEAL